MEKGSCQSCVIVDARPPDSGLRHAAPVALLLVAALLTPAGASAWWRPRPGVTWRWQITGRVAVQGGVVMQDLDLFDARPGEINSGIIPRLHRLGVRVICYVDTGAWESYRPDARLFPRTVIGAQTYASNGRPWSGEHWLDIRRRSWSRFAPIIWRRFDLARTLGCDGVEPDQNNPVGNHPGFPITLADQKAWYLEVARQAHARGLSVGQKNGIETTDSDTVHAFDWDLNEECFQYDECRVLERYVRAGKAVFSAEYTRFSALICARSRRLGFSTIFKHLDLGPWERPCRPAARGPRPAHHPNTAAAAAFTPAANSS